MDETDGNRTLADGRCHPPDDIFANVARSEDARHARFQQEWVASQLPVLRPSAITNQIRPGEDEPDLG